jgi:crotonobetainyl-CoA:carnitine CoA-transferase CaiB-like acyl-CoA transferase
MMDFQAMRWLMNKEIAGQSGNDHPTSSPTGVFPTQNGHMNIAAMGNDIFARLCKVIGAEELIDDARFTNVPLRAQNRKALNAAIADKTQLKPTEEWIDLMNQKGVPCGPILSMDQTFENEQVQHLEMAAPLKHPKLGDIHVVGQAVKFSRSEFGTLTPAPEHGEHNQSVYATLGLSQDELDALKQEGVI